MIAGNFSNNFQYVPEWLWDKHISPVQFTVYMALRSFSYPTGPTIEMLSAKIGFEPEIVLETVQSLNRAGLAEPCPTDEYGQPCDDRWRFCYLKYNRDASDRAPVPAPDNIKLEDRLKQFEAQSKERKEAFYAANPGAKEADERRRLEDAELRAADQKRREDQQRNLLDPNYLRTGGPINPDICGMVDAVKHLCWSAMASISDMQYKLAELTGLALLDPDANSALQEQLCQLAEDVDRATISNVVDRDELEAHDFLYEEEFSNTYSDGREITVKIGIENEMDTPEAKDNRFILESFAVLAFPRGVVYHINPVAPPKTETIRGEDAP
ncbi:hypothetical protein [Mycolicibacterium fortuitum]|uniref:hypothetical protein n=1 Tax=Mycolicibacterium fortuitum TaxID=1766 RepID=UPI000A958201|nr:hypothetical protein [Mycolicibacterium fortuitum]